MAAFTLWPRISDVESVTEEWLGELAKAATSIGREIGSQRGRPIFAFLLREELFVVAVEIGNNGYIISNANREAPYSAEAGEKPQDGEKHSRFTPN